MDCDNFFNLDENKTINFIEKKTKFVRGKTINKKTGKVISAIILLIFGETRVEKLTFMQKKKYKIIEDAAESLGSKYKMENLEGSILEQ